MIAKIGQPKIPQKKPDELSPMLSNRAARRADNMNIYSAMASVMKKNSPSMRAAMLTS